MTPLLLAIFTIQAAHADPWLIGAGVRQVFREDASFDALTLSAGPTWGPLALEATAGWGLSPLEPTTSERILASVANVNGGHYDVGVEIDRATVGLALAWSPPMTTSGVGGPRAVLGLEARRLLDATLSSAGEGAPVTDLDGWYQFGEDARIGFGPTLGLGFAFSPVARTSVRVDALDRMLIGPRDGVLDEGASTDLRHDWTLALTVGAAVGGGR